MFTQIEEQRTAAGTPRAELQRELLKRALRFYEGMESRASSPEERTRVLERAKQIRSKLGDVANERRS